jgi:hypothetical protein
VTPRTRAFSCTGQAATVVLFGFLAAATLRAQPTLRGPELQINAYTTGSQGSPDVAADGSDFVVVWSSYGQGVRGRRFAAGGQPLAAELQVSDYTPPYQFGPAVASAASGFVVVWNTYGQDGDSWGIFGRRFDLSGNPSGGEFQINTFTVGDQYSPAIAMDATGFVVVWRGGAYATSTIFARRYDAMGVPVSGAFQVSTIATGYQSGPAVALDGAGRSVVVWEGDLDGSVGGLRARLFDASDTPLANEFQVNVWTLSFQGYADVSRDASGFVVAWSSQDQDGSAQGVFARRYDSTGTLSSPELQINLCTEGIQRKPRVKLAGGGDFVVVWDSEQDGSGLGIFARSFRTDGSPTSGEIQINAYVPGFQIQPRVAIAGSRFMVVWESDYQDGYGGGAFGRRLRFDEFTLDVDGDGTVQPLTDALLILRYAFGFRGAVLVSGAVDAACTRCDAPAIEDYLAGEL